MADLKQANTNLERQSLWFISQGKTSSLRLFTLLNEDHFNNSVNKSVWNRIKFSIKRNNELPSWDDLLEDTVFPESSRLLLKNFNTETKITKQRCDEIFDRMEHYRRIRIIYQGTKLAIEDKLINADSINLDDIIDTLATVVHKARSTAKDDEFFIYGKGGNVDGVVDDVLNKGIPCIPSGITAWDSQNGGLPLASVMLVGANSGAGKTLVADVLAHNCAEYGAKTCYTSMEMDINELTVRRMSANSSIDQGKIFTNSKLDIAEKEKLKSEYKEREKRWAKEGKAIYTKVPKNNPSMEELLLSLKPYAFDVIIIDFITLLKGMTGENQWQKLIDGVNFAKSYARNTGALVIILVQLTAEQRLKYATGMIEGADLAWFFTKDQTVIDTGILRINTAKARKQKPINFDVKAEYEYSRIKNLPPDYKPPEAKDMINKDIKNKINKPNGGKIKTKSDELMDKFCNDNEKPKKKAA